ncbi:hypothetical protein GCM10009080_24880 [Cupriavidus pauculus]
MRAGQHSRNAANAGVASSRDSNLQLSYIDMATKAKPTAKTATKPAAKKAAATKAPVKAAAKKAAAPAKKAAPAAAPTPKPLKDTFNKSSLVAHLVAQTQLEAKAVKTVLAHLENTIVSALNKKGAGEFTLPGLLKVTAQQVPAKKKRFGKDPFTGEERWFPAKPASVKVKVRPLKKLKDAAA